MIAHAFSTLFTPSRRRLAAALGALIGFSMPAVSAHVVRGILFPTQATAFV